MENIEVSDTLIERIEKALLSIKPYLEADGGDVRILSVDDHMIVKLELLGACGTCPMSAMTMKAGITEAIIKAVPEVKGVIATNVTTLENPFSLD